MMPVVGETAPDFTLRDQQGVAHRLADYRGYWVLLYFYPKDDTPGCTKQACGLRDQYPAISSRALRILGISVDSVVSHKKFAEKYQLPFTLLADEDKTVVQQYGVWAKKKFMGKEHMGILRTSFLIDPQGSIAKIYEQVKPDDHASVVLSDQAAAAAER